LAAVLGGALLLAAGLLAIARGALWPAMSGRYERGGGGADKVPRSRMARETVGLVEGALER